jgi:predicted kinase
VTLEHVLWLGGGCGAGKTTVARALAHRLGLRLYPVDAFSFEHEARARAAPEGSFPTMQAAAAMTYAQRWVEPDVQEQADVFVRYARERHALVLADLEALPASPLVLAEGPGLLPELIAPSLGSPGHAVVLVPDDDFARAGVERRGMRVPASEAASAEAVRATRLERDRLLNAYLRREAMRCGINVIGVDASTPVDVVERLVEERFAPLLARPGATARHAAQRSELRRWEDAAIARNVAAYRRWLANS